MADQDGLAACKAAYETSVANFFQELIANLASATTPDQKQAAIDAFKRGMQLCKEARQICEQACE